MQADTTLQVEQAIQRTLVDESETVLSISSNSTEDIPLTVVAARRIIECLREIRRLNTLEIHGYSLHCPTVLSVLRDGLRLCTAVTTVGLRHMGLGNEALERLLPGFSHTSIRSLTFSGNDIQGQHGGEVLRDLLVGNNTLSELDLSYNRIGLDRVRGLGIGFAVNDRLQNLNLTQCAIGNEGLANLLPANGMMNNSLTNLDLGNNDIEGTDGGRKLTLLLQRFPALKWLGLCDNTRLGPLGARALAPGLAAARNLKALWLYRCGLGNDGVANLVPDGQENRSLITLGLRHNSIQGLVGGENVIALASRCPNLGRFVLVDTHILSDDQRRRLDLLLDRKRLVTKASALAGSPFSVLFRAVEEAHRHEHGLGAIFVILQNDGEDYFCNANNRAMEME